MSSAADYWVGPTIGEGAFGHVVYAIHKATERKVAIKVMEVPTTTTTTSHRTREEDRRHGILRQHEEHQLKQKTAMILNERRILSLPGFKSSKWMATGGDLAGLIRRGLLSSSSSPSSSSSQDHRFGSWRRSSVLSYASQLIEAVEFLHSWGIWHCDLKPENVLLDATTGHLLLADFGCALDTKQQQQEQEPEEPQALLFPRGTALYASPEILRASSPCVLTVAVDYWSVGCMLHAMLHGQSPFDRGSEALTVRAIVAYAAGEKECDCDSTASNGTSRDKCESDKGCFETSNSNKNDNEDRAIGDSRNRNKNIVKNKPPNAIPSTERSAENKNESEDQNDDDDSLQLLSQDLLAVDPDDRISAWKNGVLSFLASHLNSNDRDGDNDHGDGNYLSEDGSSDPPSGKNDIPPSVSACARNKDILLPIPEWEDEVANATLRDGSLGWCVFQL
eukprot:CAMPEP_0170939592 /NCGR_PEP_ID=MMETSP0735-20130129/22055_1 /TAXON_ID=186038 /ORGANISM="Fragilariopsis kerguelensis, Strain L26-C5" /LENGTH=448 /DNA_ID=CAMNT_0011345061 /DNA_START=152 /DNA_END=1498 /DNA_ORIENTATION=+